MAIGNGLINTINKNSTFGTSNIYLVPTFDVSKLEEEITAKLIDTNLLAISDDGVNFEEEKEIYTTSIAGLNEKRVRGLERIIKSEGKITGTGKVVNKQLLNASLYTKQENKSTKYDVWKIKEGYIDDANYSDVVMVGRNKDNELAQMIVLHNAYNTSLSVETKGKEDYSCKLEFVSCYELDKLNESPYEIITLAETV